MNFFEDKNIVAKLIKYGHQNGWHPVTLEQIAQERIEELRDSETFMYLLEESSASDDTLFDYAINYLLENSYASIA